MKEIATPVGPAAASRSQQKRPLACDACGSDQLRKYSVVYEEQHGTSTSKTKMAGVGLGSGGVGAGIGAGKTSGITTTQLAQRVAPPSKEAMVKNDSATTLATVATLIVGFGAAYIAYQAAGFMWAVGVFVVVFIVGVAIGGNISEVDQRYRKAYAEWDRKYICMKCGATKSQTVEDWKSASKVSSADPELDRLIRAGEKIQAVKHVRDRTGVGLAEALEVVERRTAVLS